MNLAYKFFCLYYTYNRQYNESIYWKEVYKKVTYYTFFMLLSYTVTPQIVYLRYFVHSLRINILQ